MPTHDRRRPEPHRTAGVVRAELAEVRRHLLDAPPHHGAGLRDSLHRRQRALEVELARLEATTNGR